MTTTTTQSDTLAKADSSGPTDNPGPDESTPRTSSGTVFLTVNLTLFILVILVASPSSERPKLTPNTQPVVVTPLYNDPTVVSDDQLQRVLHKVRPAFRNGTTKLNTIDHALRLWSPKAVFDDPDCLSGTELLGLLTDHRQYQQHWGTTSEPFLLANTRFESPYIEFRTRSGAKSSSHVDHTLATLAESGIPLDYPVQTEQGELPLRAAFAFSFDRFRLNQAEYEWSALAFLHYLPHKKSWVTKEGQRITWDMIARRLMRQKLTQGSCYGTHRLHTLVCILRANEDNAILSEECRKDVTSHLKDATARLVQTQHKDGYWTEQWQGIEWDGPPRKPTLPIDNRSQRILATGHTLEWWALAPEELLPKRDRIILAAQWIVTTTDGMSDSDIANSYTFLTHAARALSLWRGKFPPDAYRPTNKVTDSASTTDVKATRTEDSP